MGEALGPLNVDGLANATMSHQTTEYHAVVKEGNPSPHRPMAEPLSLVTSVRQKDQF